MMFDLRYTHNLSLLFGIWMIFYQCISTVLMDDSASHVQPCKFHDPGNGSCLKDLLQNILITGTTEIRGMKRNALDPYKAKKARVSADSEIVKLNMEFTKVIVTGLSKSIILSAKASSEETLELDMKVPMAHIKGDYSMDGRVLVLNLSGKGVFETDFADVDATIALGSKIVQHSNDRYYEVKSVKSRLKHIGDLKVNFSNLFANNQALTDSANDVFNQNWMELIEVMRPVIEESMNAAILQQANKILDKIPLRQIFSDLA
ncbi:protein takeout-like [Haematobia irritans]|uniref:protein takeout-like n=1 Tax=Haematobia irritans TaxID=7368 RepID=UPI003F508B08